MVMLLVIYKGVMLELLELIIAIYNLMLCCILKICLLWFSTFYSLCDMVFLYFFLEKCALATNDRMLIDSP